MQLFTKRYIAYFSTGVIAAATVHGDLILIAPVAIFIDLTVELVRSRYQDFKDEQQKILDALSEK